MAKITLKGNPINTVGDLPAIGAKAPTFALVDAALAPFTGANAAGKKIVLNIFPSIDTPTCATSVRKFNADAAKIPDTVVVCVSLDLPFALKRFCGAEGITGVTPTSAFRSTFGTDYGIRISDGPLAGLLARAVVVIDTNGIVRYTELVPEIAQEPDYAKALAAVTA